MKRVWIFVAMMTGLTTLAGCEFAAGAGTAVAADELAEQNDGDDGLF